MPPPCQLRTLLRLENLAFSTFFELNLCGYRQNVSKKEMKMTGNRLRRFLMCLLMAAACSAVACAPRWEYPPHLSTTPRPQLIDKLASSYSSYLGVPYAEGGRNSSGMDCSGLVYKAFAEAGVSLPRSAREMWKVGKRVHYRNLRKGDLVFFKTKRERVSHVGILHDPENKIFIHASSSRGVVLSSIEERYYKKRYIGARRVIL